MLEFRFETDGQARADLLSGGDVDFAMNLPEGDTSDPYPQTTLLLLNQRTGSLESESLRRALALAIDRNALTEGQPLDPAQGIVPPGLRNTMGGDFRQGSGSLVDNEPDNYEALCQQARTLLEEAGGVKAAGQITLLYDSTDETAARTAAAVQDAWKQKLGLIAILRGATAQELADALDQGEFMVALTTVTADLPGRVRLDGVDWNARCSTPGDTLTPGQRCRVTELHSTLLIVEPVLTESRRA